MSYLIGGEVFTLQDIENGVLRGNRKGMAQLRRPFSKTDPRLQVLDLSVKPPTYILLHRINLRCHILCCPLGGAAGRWASHSFCPELRSKRLPTNQNLYSTGNSKRPCHTSPQGVGHQNVSVEWLNIKSAPSGYWQSASNSCWGLPWERWRLRGGFWEKRSATQSDI